MNRLTNILDPARPVPDPRRRGRHVLHRRARSGEAEPRRAGPLHPGRRRPRLAGSSLTAGEARAATEPECEIIAFSAPAGGGYGGKHGGGESGITRVTLSPRMQLDDVIHRLQAIPMGGADCALPMARAGRNKLRVSGFVTYTDSETWAGNIPPAQALRLYRDEFVSEAKAVVVGFDATVPAVIADFVRS